MTFVEARGVQKLYPPRRGHPAFLAVDNVDLSIAEGEFVALLGPSGCGKSTLLNMIAGFIAPSDGELLLEDSRIKRPGPDRGVVFQEEALFPWSNVEKNIMYGPLARKVPKREVKARAKNLIKIVGLAGFEHRLPYELSGGMRQRVALARVLINDPLILLLDEPFGALDAQTRQLMQEELASLWMRTKLTVLLVTHSIDEAIFLGDRVAVMTASPGRIKEIMKIDLPRPRDTTSDEFNAYRRHARNLIHSEAMSAFKQEVAESA